jgi:hypothetical protein
MPEYEQTGRISAEPDTLFEYLANVEHLPDYLPVITDAHPAGEEIAEVTTDIGGKQERARGYVRVDSLERRMTWGTPGGRYHGWLWVRPDETDLRSLVTIHVSQPHASDADDDLIEALDNIRLLADSGQLPG